MHGSLVVTSAQDRSLSAISKQRFQRIKDRGYCDVRFQGIRGHL